MASCCGDSSINERQVSWEEMELLRGSLGLRAFVTMPGAWLSCPGLRLAGGVLTKAAQD